MSKVRRIDFSPDEWIAGTLGLTVDQCGVYIQACSLIYSRGGPIEKAHLRQICSCDRRRFEAALSALVEGGKLVEKEGKLTQKRCEKELERAMKRLQTLVENGRNGGRPSHKNNNIENLADSSTRARAEPSTITINYQQEEEEARFARNARAREATPDGFTAWWEEYPHKVGKRAAEQSYRQALARAGPAELLDGLRRYVRTKPPDRQWCNPATWLNQDRWLDRPQEPVNGPADCPIGTLAGSGRRRTESIVEAIRQIRAAREGP